MRIQLNICCFHVPGTVQYGLSCRIRLTSDGHSLYLSLSLPLPLILSPLLNPIEEGQFLRFQSFINVLLYKNVASSLIFPACKSTYFNGVLKTLFFLCLLSFKPCATCTRSRFVALTCHTSHVVCGEININQARF